MAPLDNYSFFCSHGQQPDPRSYVSLLCSGCLWPQGSEISLLEKIPHHSSNGSILMIWYLIQKNEVQKLNWDRQAQFVSALVLGTRALIYGCDFPIWMQYALVIYMSSFLFLFGQYYRQAYLQKKQVIFWFIYIHAFLVSCNYLFKHAFCIFRRNTDETAGRIFFTIFSIN